MREDFVETMVKKSNNMLLTALMVLFYMICAGFVILALLAGSVSFFLIAIIAGVIAYICGHFSKIEYEYSYCDREMDVDAIYSQNTRRHKATYDLNKMEAMVRINGSKMKEFAGRNLKTIDYSSGIRENKDSVYAIFYDGTTKLLIEPDEKLLEAIKYMFPRKVFED